MQQTAADLNAVAMEAALEAKIKELEHSIFDIQGQLNADDDTISTCSSSEHAIKCSADKASRSQALSTSVDALAAEAALEAEVKALERAVQDIQQKLDGTSTSTSLCAAGLHKLFGGLFAFRHNTSPLERNLEA